MSKGECEDSLHDDTMMKFSDTPSCKFSDVNQVLQTGLQNHKPYVFLELCAGSASLSAEVKKLGVQALAFDHDGNRHQTKCKVVSLDLSLPHASGRITELVNTCNILGAHLGPPCGTCSKARGIPLPDGSAGPQPLRSDEFLLGLPGLSTTDRNRVEAANALYEQLGRFVELFEQHGLPWTIENPTNSFLWDLPFFAFAMAHGIKYDCHACAFGSSRKKATSFLSNRHEFQAMSVFCQDVPTHEHEGWGYDYEKRCFNTAKEAEYPAGMCRRYAQVLGEFLDVDLLQPKLPRMLPQAQPKGRKLPQLIPEFLDVVTCLLAEIPQVDAKKNVVHDVGKVPKGSRLLRAEANKGNTGRFLCVFGIFRSMEQFVSVRRPCGIPLMNSGTCPML